jgi:hypothetical protein
MQRGETGRGGPEPADPYEVNAARLRLLIAAALGQLSAEHRAVISRSYYLGWTTAQIADDLHIAEWFVKARLHFAVRALRLTLERSPPAVHGRTRLERSWTRTRAQEETLHRRSRLTLLCMPDLHLYGGAKGGASGNRTPDLLDANQRLSTLVT